MTIALNILNNFALTTANGRVVYGNQGPLTGAFDEEYAPSTSGLIHLVSTTLATATVVTVWDDDNDFPVDFDYLFYVADQITWLQIVGASGNAQFKLAAGMPFVLSGYDNIVVAADTTIITGGTEPTPTDIDSVAIGNYSGNTANYVFAVID